MRMRRVVFASLIIPTVALASFAAPDTPGDDTFYLFLPKEIGRACKETFPGYRILRVVEHRHEDARSFTITFFSDTGVLQGREEGGDLINELLMYQLKVAVGGEVLEEPLHPIPVSHVPRRVLEGYKKWNRAGKGLGESWGAERQRGGRRSFLVNVLPVPQVGGYSAWFDEDGRLIRSTPPPPADSIGGARETAPNPALQRTRPAAAASGQSTVPLGGPVR